MIFYHDSEKIIKKITNATLTINIKPKINALWLSCNDDWIKYVKDVGLKRDYKYKYEFVIDLSNLKILKTFNDIKKFNDKYGFIDNLDEFYNKYGFKISLDLIDWNKVEKDGYYGLYIVNANIKKANDLYFWYSTFNICSAVIWNKDAVISFKKIK